MSETMGHVAYGMTDVGRRREMNQDALLVNAEAGLYAIADGMGGHAAGEVASRIAIKSLADSVSSDPERTRPADPAQAERRLVDAVNDGNRRIFETVLGRDEWRGMGTTLVALQDLGAVAVIGHVGDSRVYRLRDERLERMTSDHSWVGEQVRLGLMSEDEAARHPMRNIVTRAMGNRPEVDVDLTHAAMHPGDVFLLCSDGLNSMLVDEEIAEILARHADDPRRACESLIEAANRAGGEDNISVIVVSAAA